MSGFLICGAPALSPREHGGPICGEPLIASTRGREELPVYVCRAVKAGKGPGYCGNTTAIPRADLHTAVIASLRKTFSAESFPAHQQRVANDTEAKRSRQAQRENLTVELPKLQAKAARLAKMVADLDDTGDLLFEYQTVQKKIRETKDTLAYLDKVEREDAAKAADVDTLVATWSDWVKQADANPDLARQMLRKVLSTPIVVAPTGKGSWTFAGFSRFDEVLRGGIGRDPLVSTVLSELRDSETSQKMMAYLNQALAAAVADLVPDGVKVRFVLREDEPTLPPIAGGSDAHSVGSDVGSSDMAPNPQTLGAPRHSHGAPRVTRSPDMAPKPPNARRAPAQPWRPSSDTIPRHGPQTPKRSARPGTAMAPLD